MRTLKPVYPFENVFPAVLKGMLPTMLWDETFPPAIRLDVEESDKAYMIKAEIPGVKKEDIFVDVNGAVVTFRAEVRREVENKEFSELHSERFFGMLTRTFTLPMEVDADTTTARYEKGVLWLRLPKKLEAPVHRVMVN